MSDPETAPGGVAGWRKARREELIAGRLVIPADTRAAYSQAIADALDRALGDVAGKAISLYWPFRGEPDLRGWLASVNSRGATTLLPIVVEKRRPLIFKPWKPGDRLDRGVWNIPIPAEGPDMLPDIVISPLVGFDPQLYRLGYGGGFFDRTLAAHPGKPLERVAAIWSHSAGAGFRQGRGGWRRAYPKVRPSRPPLSLAERCPALRVG